MRRVYNNLILASTLVQLHQFGQSPKVLFCKISAAAKNQHSNGKPLRCYDGKNNRAEKNSASGQRVRVFKVVTIRSTNLFFFPDRYTGGTGRSNKFKRFAKIKVITNQLLQLSYINRRSIIRDVVSKNSNTTRKDNFSQAEQPRF